MSREKRLRDCPPRSKMDKIGGGYAPKGGAREKNSLGRHSGQQRSAPASVAVSCNGLPQCSASDFFFRSLAGKGAGDGDVPKTSQNFGPLAWLNVAGFTCPASLPVPKTTRLPGSCARGNREHLVVRLRRGLGIGSDPIKVANVFSCFFDIIRGIGRLWLLVSRNNGHGLSDSTLSSAAIQSFRVSAFDSTR